MVSFLGRCRLNGLGLEICIYIYMHACNNYWKRSMTSKKSIGEVYGGGIL